MKQTRVYNILAIFNRVEKETHLSKIEFLYMSQKPFNFLKPKRKKTGSSINDVTVTWGRGQVFCENGLDAVLIQIVTICGRGYNELATIAWRHLWTFP